MAKKISAKDIFTNEDIFKNIRQSAEDTIVSLGKINTEFKKTASTLKSTIGQTKFDSTKSIKEFILLTEKANKLAQESAKVEALKSKALQQSAKASQELEKIQQQKIKTESANIRLARQQATEQERTAKAQERSAKTARDETNAYKQLEKATRDLKNQSKELGAEMLKLEMTGKKNSAEYRKLSTIYGDVTKKAQQGDAQLKKLDQTVGDNFRNVGNYEGAMRKLSAGLSALGIGVGLGTVLKFGADAIINFNQQVADLSAITGASGRDLAFFSEQANKLGVNVEGGASAVVEAYKLIGSAKPELLENAQALDKVAQSAITLSQASGMTLQDSATALTDAMNQFGASAEDADKFVNVLANGAKFGSAEIPQITEALLKFGAVAKSTGTSVEESTAMIELLAEKGLKGAEAGTALRNVMLKLSAPDALPREAKRRLTELGISLKELENPALSITDKLKMLSPLMKDNGALMKTFGIENATSALALIQNTKRIDELNASMQTQGTSTEQAKLRTNTLGHALMELKNSFTGLFTQIGTGGGAMQNVIDSFKYLGANLGTIMGILGRVVRTWLLYKGTLKAIQAQQWIANGGFKELGNTIMKQIPMTRAYRLEQITLARAQTTAGQSAQTAGNAMKAIPWVLIISSLVELYNWWSSVASASAEARRQNDLYKKSVEDAKKKVELLTEGQDKQTAEKLRKLDIEIRKRKANGEDEKKLDLEQVKRTDAINQQAKSNYATKIKDAKQTLDELNKKKAEFIAMDKIVSVMGDRGRVNQENTFRTMGISGTNTLITQQRALIDEMQKGQKHFSDVVDESNISLLEAQTSQEDYSVVINKTSESYKGAIDNAKEYSTTLGDVNDYLQESIDLMQQLDEIFQNRAVEKMTKDIDALIEKTKLEAEAGKGAFGLTLKVAKTPEEDKATDKANLDLLLTNNTELNKLIEDRYLLEQKNLEQRNTYAKGNIDMANQVAQETELNKLLDEKLKLLAQDGISPEDKAKVEANYITKLGELRIENAQRDEDARLKKLLLDEKLADDEKKLGEDKVKTKEESNKKILEGDKQFHKDVVDAQSKTDTTEVDNLKKKEELKQQIINQAFDYFKSKSDAKIAQIENEITASQKQYDYYQKLAEEGNINASQSMAEQQKIIAEANKKKAMEQKKQAYMELAKTAYSTYQGKVDAKSKNPLADTIKDITLLQAFIRTIPTFEDGIEDTGATGKGIDGKGGFHAILHPNERVVPKALNQQIGSLSNTELANLATNYRAGKIGDTEQSGSALDLAILVNEIKDLKSVIKNKPETNIELGEITASIMEVVQSTRKGNQTTYNRFKIRK